MQKVQSIIPCTAISVDISHTKLFFWPDSPRVSWLCFFRNQLFPPIFPTPAMEDNSAILILIALRPEKMFGWNIFPLFKLHLSCFRSPGCRSPSISILPCCTTQEKDDCSEFRLSLTRGRRDREIRNKIFDATETTMFC